MAGRAEAAGARVPHLCIVPPRGESVNPAPAGARVTPLPEAAPPLLAGLAAALAVALGIAATGRWHGRFSFDTLAGPHKFHRRPTPRVGGFAVLAGILAAAAAAPPPAAGLLLATAAAAVPALAAGLAEDFTHRVGPVVRFVATIASGLVFCLATGHAVDALDLPLVDRALAVPAAAVAFTAFAMGGLAHAVNIVDGFHGLASGTVILMLGALALAADRAGDPGLALFCLALAAAQAGFLAVNFPAGRIFLGDGGAYLAGFGVAAAAVMLPARSPEVSPWTSMLALAYPVLEVLASAARKRLRGGRAFEPDRLHLHMLVHRRWGRGIARALGRPGLANPATGALMWTGPLACLLAAALLPARTPWALAGCAAMAALYALAYRAAARAPLGRRKPPGRRGRAP